MVQNVALPITVLMIIFILYSIIKLLIFSCMEIMKEIEMQILITYCAEFIEKVGKKGNDIKFMA